MRVRWHGAWEESILEKRVLRAASDLQGLFAKGNVDYFTDSLEQCNQLGLKWQ